VVDPADDTIETGRLEYLSQWLGERGGAYRSILVCDVRDVFFQGDPFAWAGPAGFDAVHVNNQTPNGTYGHGGMLTQLGKRWVDDATNAISKCNPDLIGAEIKHTATAGLDYFSVSSTTYFKSKVQMCMGEFRRPSSRAIPRI
jgi:hypothetical protein